VYNQGEKRSRPIEIQNWNALDIKFSAAKMEVIWTLLNRQKANESCAIKGLRKTSVWKQKKNWESAQVRVLEGFQGYVFFIKKDLATWEALTTSEERDADGNKILEQEDRVGKW
jgi:hypothetical protein